MLWHVYCIERYPDMICLMRTSWRHMRVGVLLLALVLGGCAFTRPAFSRFAGNTGGELAAAATTLRYLHTGKLTAAYARSSFVNYASQLQGVAQQLQSMTGGPGPGTMHRLTRLYRRAQPAITRPCLGSGCNWRAQVRALQRASDAFVGAGGG